MSVLARARAPTSATTLLRFSRLRRPAYSTPTILARVPYRSNYSASGFTSSYDPNQETGRGPIFNKHTFGVPQFYPRDLKARVDDYVVGQERAKKTICSVIFNHYQGLRRRQYHELQDQRLREKLHRQKYAQEQEAFERAGYTSSRTHPVEGGRWTSHRSEEFPSAPQRQADDSNMAYQDEYAGNHEAVRGTYQMPDNPYEPPADDFYIPEDLSPPDRVKIDKSNLLLIGPTGVGKTYILE